MKSVKTLVALIVISHALVALSDALQRVAAIHGIAGPSATAKTSRWRDGN